MVNSTDHDRVFVCVYACGGGGVNEEKLVTRTRQGGLREV